LNTAEKNYSTPEKECLAMVWAILYLRPYLEGQRFLIRTDQVALKWLLSLKDPSGRLARWRLRLAEFEFTIQYRPGIKNSLADGCSRVKTDGGDTTTCHDDIPCFLIDTEEDEQEICLSIISEPPELPTAPTLKEISRAQQEESECRKWNDSAKLKDSKFVLVSKNGVKLLYRKSDIDGHLRLCIPQAFRKTILNLAHYPVTAGHPGGRKMFNTLSRDYYWPGLSFDTYQLVSNCHECTKENGALRKRRKHITLFPASGPLEFVAIDLLGPLPKTSRGFQYILVVADRFTKLVRTVPLKSITTMSIANAFCHHWIFVYGPPKTLLSDNGTQFNSKFFQACCQILGVGQVFTTAYHPQCNGQVERFNRTLLSQLRCYIGDHQDDWDLYHAALTYAYNTQIHTSTNQSPFNLVLSRPPPPFMLHASGATVIKDPKDAAEYKQNFLKRLQLLIPEVRKSIGIASTRMKQYADKSVLPTSTESFLGKMIYVRNEVKANKLSPKFKGPYKVTEETQDTGTYRDEHGIMQKATKDRLLRSPS
jgi:RNase H-like domain found in reverse transcriptase/Integrase zinc binding domain/Integrase core domain